MSFSIKILSNLLILLMLIDGIYTERRYVRQTATATATATAANDENSNNNSYHEPHFMENRSVIVQLFEWKFVDIATECRTFLGPQGYAGVQLSPVLEHTVVKTDEITHPWWERYELISYRLASRSGDESEFWSMSRICNEHGVRVYVDLVLNHMAAPLHLLIKDADNNKDFTVNTLLATNVNISQRFYANVTYSHLDFHRPECDILPTTQDAHELRNCQLNGHPDLDHSRGNVQKPIVKMMNKFIDMGVAGFRIDKAKYMWPIDLRNIYQQLKNLNTEFNFEPYSRPFIYQDVFDLGLDSVSKTEYITYGVVSEYLYAAELATVFNGKAPLSSLINWGPAMGFLPTTDALVFIDSHDTQRGLPTALGLNRLLTYKQRIKYIMANAFMLVHPYGSIKRIMSSYYFKDDDINQGPPTEDEEGEDIRSPQFDKQQQCKKTSGWVCEHRWPALVALVQMANYFAALSPPEESIVYFQTNGPNQVAFCRGSQAFVAINNDKELDFNMEVYACLEPGIYCDVVSGGRKETGKEGCHGKQVIINEQGYVKLQLAVADDNRLETEDEMENEIEQDEVKQTEEQEEETGIIESYGILVIYRGSKIEAATMDTNVATDGHEAVDENSLSKQDTKDEAMETEANAEEEEIQNQGNEKTNENEANEVETATKSNENNEEENNQEDVDAENEVPNEGPNENQSGEAENTEAKENENENEEDNEVPDEEEVKENASQKNSNEFENEGPDEEQTSNENQGNKTEEPEEDENEKENEEEMVEPEEDKEVGEEENIKVGEEEVEENVSQKNSNEVENEDPGEEQTSNENQINKTEEPEEEENEKENEEEMVEPEENKEVAEEEDASQKSSSELENETEEETKAEDEDEEEQTNDEPVTSENESEPEVQVSTETEVNPDSKETNLDEEKENPEDNTEKIEEDTETNQSRNLDDPNIEEQVERPSADIVENSTEEKAKKVLTAGFLSNSKANGHNG